jgi:uncharacterized SAM-binding protein YcdF (DUF218 family)
MKRWHIYSIIALVICLQFVLFRGAWLKHVADYLIYQDNIVPAEAVLVLGGGKQERVEQAVALYHAKFAGTVLLTGMYMGHGWKKPITHWAVEGKALAESAGVPPGRAIPIFGSRSTFEDATLSRAYCLQHNIRSLIVVSEPYHTKRARLVFDKVYKGSGISVMLHPVHNSWYQADSWWKTRAGASLTGMEYVKLFYYLLKGQI